MALDVRTGFWCCDRKARAASALSFTVWQQATIEITRHDHSVIACSCHIYMGVILRAHPVCGESLIQRNANREVATRVDITQEPVHPYLRPLRKRLRTQVENHLF